MSELTNKRSRSDFEEEVKVDADADADAAAEETSIKRCKGGEAKKQTVDLFDKTLLETVLLNCSEEGSDVELKHKGKSFVVKVTRITDINEDEVCEWDGIVISYANRRVECKLFYNNLHNQNKLQKPLWQVVEEIKLMLQGKSSIYKCLFKWKTFRFGTVKWIDTDVRIDLSNNLPKVSKYINVHLQLGEDYPQFRVHDHFYFLLQNGYTFDEDTAHGFVQCVRDTFKHKIIATVVTE